MKRIIKSSLLLILLGFQSLLFASETTEQQLNKAAESFVKLGLELGEYDKDYVDAYLGPKEWRDHAKKNLRSKAELSKAIHALYQSLKAIKPAEDDLKVRHKALTRTVRAMNTRARMVNGETFSFAEEARLIYDAVLPNYSYTEFDKILEQIAELIPGDEALSIRVDAFRNSFSIPQDAVSKVVDVAISECRNRASKFIQLPENESFTLEYVKDKSWSGYNWYQGKNHSLMQINQDFPMSINRAVDLGCHEGYPGHHVWNVLVENNLLKGKGWIEFSIFPLFSPYGLIAEGSGNFGVEMAFPGDEKNHFEKTILYPMAGLDPKRAAKFNELNELMGKLSHSSNLIAQQYLDGEISREQAIDLRVKYSLVSKDRAEQRIRFIEQYRAYVLNYNLGMDIVANYVNSQSELQDGRWKAFESILTELSTASDLQ